VGFVATGDGHGAYPRSVEYYYRYSLIWRAPRQHPFPFALKERMEARRPRRLERMRSDSIRPPSGAANRHGAARPAAV